MTDQRPPKDPSQPEDAEGIIELTEVVASPQDDGEPIIDLTEVVEEDADQEAVIELTDVIDVPLEAATADDTPVEAPAEDPVIELTEVVDTAAAETKAAAQEDVPEPVLEEEESQAPADEAEESTSGDLEFADMELDIEDRTDDELFDSLGLNMEADLLPAEEDTSELDFNLSTQELSDAIDLLDAKLAEEPPKEPRDQEEPLREPSALRTEELETALENVIRKMFGEKIDYLLNEAIEKTVSKEIEQIKAQLLGDTSDKR